MIFKFPYLTPIISITIHISQNIDFQDKTSISPSLYFFQQPHFISLIIEYCIIMSLKRVSREKGRTPSPSPITIYSNEIIRSKKSSIFNKGEHPFSSRRLSSKQQHSKSAKQKSKYRIITEPIEHINKIQHLVNSNIFGNASFQRLPAREKEKEKQKEREKEREKDRHKTIDKNSQIFETKVKCHECTNCSNLRQKNHKLLKQLQYYKSQTLRVLQTATSWKNTKISIQHLKDQYRNNREIIPQITAMKQLIQDLARDIESLSKIDLVKMLKSEIFSYQQHQSTTGISTKVSQARFLLMKLKSSVVNPEVFGKINKGSNQDMMLRNLKARLNGLMKENMEMKIKLQLMDEEIDVSSVNTDNFKMVIHHAIKK